MYCGVTVSGRTIKNLCCTNDPTLVVENAKELQDLEMKVKAHSEKKMGLQLNIKKTKINDKIYSNQP